jgi:hypothetical protein
MLFVRFDLAAFSMKALDCSGSSGLADLPRVIRVAFSAIRRPKQIGDPNSSALKSLTP